jgi:diacylglycerol kinase (ATP)
MTSEKIAVLFNPSSGRGRAADRKAEVEAGLRKNGVTFDLFVTESEAELKSLAVRAGRSHRTVVGAGGDSTFHLIVNELVRSGASAAFGMIGTGSSNDIDREFGLDSIERACLALKTGRRRRVDLGAIMNGGRILRYFLGQANIGIGARVNIFVEELGVRRPWLARRQSLAGLLGIIRAYKSGGLPVTLTIHSDGPAVSGAFISAVFANIRYWSTGRVIAPLARPDDGLLDACFIGTCSFFRLTRIARLAVDGRHGRMKEVRFGRSRSFEVLSATPFPVQTDGEILGSRDRPDEFTRIGIESVPGALEIIAGEREKESSG